MASSILVRAKQFLERSKGKAVQIRRERQRETALVVGEIAGLATMVGCAVVDQKLGKGEQYKAGPIPVNAIAGVVAVAPAFFLNKYPVLQAASVNTGMTAIKIAGYRYLVSADGIAPGEP